MKRLLALSLLLGMPRPAEGDGRGLKFEWFDGENFETKVGQRVEAKVSSMFGDAGAGRGGAPDHFSCRWSGFIRAPRPGTYQLKGWADDGFRLKIDGETLMEGWESGKAQYATTKFTTEPREVVFEMREAESLAGATLCWHAADDKNYVVIPPSAFSQTREAAKGKRQPRARGTGLQITVFRDSVLKKSEKITALEDGIDDDINWYFEEAGIDEAIGIDHFSIRWKGYVVAPSPGPYHIKAWSDDGIRVKLDGDCIIDDWRGGSRERSAVFTFDDQPHELEVEYFENSSNALVSLFWSKDGELAEEVIPPGAFFTDLATAKAATKRSPPKQGK